MRLRELKLTRLPGIERPFAIGPGDGVNLILGPNGSGKSSLARAFHRLLWPGSGSARRSEVSASLEIAGVVHAVERLNDEPVVWSRDGLPVPAPPLPPEHLAPCYRLGLLDLNRSAAGSDDETLGREIVTRMAGGFDLGELAERLFPAAPRAGLGERRAWTQARSHSAAVLRRQRDLAQRRSRLGELEAEVEAAQLAGARRGQLERLLRIRELETRLAVLEGDLAELPAALEHLRTDDPESLGTLLDRRRQAAGQVAELERSLAGNRSRSGELGFPEGVDAGATILELEARLVDLRSRHEETERLAPDSTTPDGGSDSGVPQIDPELFQRFRKLHVQHDRAEAQRQFLQTRLESRTGKPQSLLPGWIAMIVGSGVLAAAILGPDGARTALTAIGGVVLAFGLFRLGRGMSARRDPAGNLEQELRNAESAVEAAQQQLRQLADEHGLDLDETDLLYTLKELSLAQDRRAAAEQRRARWEAARQARDEALERINGDLAQIDVAPCSDLAEAIARVGALKDRRTELLALVDRTRRDGEMLRAARDQAENADQDAHALLRRLGLENAEDPVAAVAALAAQLPRWRAVTDQRNETRADLRRLEAETRAEPDLVDAPATAAWAEEQFAARIDEEKQRANRLDELNREIGEIRGLVRQALAGTERAAALADEAARRADLEAAREGAREAALGRWLLDDVRRQNETQAQPAVLKAAAELLRRFTRNEWELLVRDEAGSGRFAAREAGTGAVRSLGELSDGTRAQLLLAVRLGFVQEQESQARPPLFVDEALTASDPARFAAVAEALAELADSQQRQVFYLTADPADVDRFAAALQGRGLPAARRIDLAEVRSLAAAADPAAVTQRALPTVPAAAGRNLAAYVDELRVPVLDPWQPAGAVHPAYLTRDESGELRTLQSLLEAGAATVGRWRRACAELEAAAIVPPAAGAELAWRALVLEDFLDGWRIGRARPLTREDLEDSGAVTERMLPNVWAECLNQGRDGTRLIAAARSRAIARFGSRQIDDLESYLEGERLLASGATLPQEQLVLHAVQFLGDRLGEGRTGEVRYWIGRFLRAVQPHAEESAEEGGSG